MCTRWCGGTTKKQRNKCWVCVRGFVFMAEFFGRAIREGLCQAPNFALFFLYFQEKKLILPLI
jgi:hypothetical protein